MFADEDEEGKNYIDRILIRSIVRDLRAMPDQAVLRIAGVTS
jgi:hypothetical protein